MGYYSPKLRPKQEFQPGIRAFFRREAARQFYVVALAFMPMCILVPLTILDTAIMPICIAGALGLLLVGSYVNSHRVQFEKHCDTLPKTNVYRLYRQPYFRWALSKKLIAKDPLMSNGPKQRRRIHTRGSFIPFPIACAWADFAYLTFGMKRPDFKHVATGISCNVPTDRIFVEAAHEQVDFGRENTTDCFLCMTPHEFCSIFCHTLKAGHGKAVFETQLDANSNSKKVTCRLQSITREKMVVKSRCCDFKFTGCMDAACPVKLAFDHYQCPPITLIYVGEALRSEDVSLIPNACISTAVNTSKDTHITVEIPSAQEDECSQGKAQEEPPVDKLTTEV